MIFFVHAKCFLLKYMAGLNFTQKIFIVRIIGEEEDIQVKGMLDDDLFIYYLPAGTLSGEATLPVSFLPPFQLLLTFQGPEFASLGGNSSPVFGGICHPVSKAEVTTVVSICKNEEKMKMYPYILKTILLVLVELH